MSSVPRLIMFNDQKRRFVSKTVTHHEYFKKKKTKFKKNKKFKLLAKNSEIVYILKNQL